MGKPNGAWAMVDGEQQRRFDALLREHQRIVFKVAAVYARNASDRDDLAQEIALQAWRSFATFDAHRAKFTTWLYRVALNVAISALRARSRDAARGAEPLGDVDAAAVVDPGSSHYARVEHAERVVALRAFIGGLDALNRALVLLYLEDRSYAEIAEVLGISETNVATKLNRIKQQLREQIAATNSAGEKNGTR